MTNFTVHDATNNRPYDGFHGWSDRAIDQYLGQHGFISSSEKTDDDGRHVTYRQAQGGRVLIFTFREVKAHEAKTTNEVKRIDQRF